MVRPPWFSRGPWYLAAVLEYTNEEVTQMYKVVALDQSTTCTGITIASIENDELIRLETTTLIPQYADATTLGYLARKVKTTTPKGDKLTSYVQFKGEIVTITEKKRRDRQVRELNRQGSLNILSKQISDLLSDVKPKLVLMEKNMAFGGILTTKQLAELAGAIRGVAAVHKIELKEVSVHQARGLYSVPVVVHDFASRHTPTELKGYGDVTKAAFRDLMLTKYSQYDLNPNMTLDESDSLVVFNYWAAVQA